VRDIMAAHYPSVIDPARDASLRQRYDIRIAREHMSPGNARWPVHRAGAGSP